MAAKNTIKALYLRGQPAEHGPSGRWAPGVTWNGPSPAQQQSVMISGFGPVGQIDLLSKPTSLMQSADGMGSSSVMENSGDLFQKSPVLDALTKDDLKLIEMTPDGAKLAQRLTRDRADGTLSGPVNRDYLESVINGQIDDLNAAEPEVPYVVLHNAERELSILNGSKYPPPLLKETNIPGVYASDSEAGNFVCTREVLTRSDKKLLMSMNGGTLNGGSEDFTQLMTTIALDRSIGSLKGDITREYLGNLISGAKREVANNPEQPPVVSVDFLYKAMAAYDAMHAADGGRVGFTPADESSIGF